MEFKEEYISRWKSARYEFTWLKWKFLLENCKWIRSYFTMNHEDAVSLHWSRRKKRPMYFVSEAKKNKVFTVYISMYHRKFSIKSYLIYEHYLFIHLDTFAYLRLQCSFIQQLFLKLCFNISYICFFFL